MPNIPVKLEEETVRKLDHLVKNGIYRSRSEAIRRMIAEKLKEKSISNIVSDSEEKLINRLLEVVKEEGGVIINLVSPKTAAELVAEGRER